MDNQIRIKVNSIYAKIKKSNGKLLYIKKASESANRRYDAHYYLKPASQ